MSGLNSSGLGNEEEFESVSTDDLQSTDAQVGVLDNQNLLKVRRDARNTYNGKGWTSFDLQFEDLTGWTAGIGSISAETTEVYAGDQSIKIESSGRADYTFASAKDFTGMAPVLTFKIPDSDTTADDITVRLFDSAGNQTAFSHRINADAMPTNWVSIALGPQAESSTPPDMTDITEIKVRTNFATAYVDNVRMVPTGEPRIIWRFDDAKTSQTEFAHSLDRYGQVGNFAVHTDLVGSGSNFLMESDVADIAERHEICSHLRDTNDVLPDLTDEEARTAIEESKRWLLERGYREGAKTLVYPGGQVDDAKFDIVAEYHELGSTTNGHGQPHGTPNPLFIGGRGGGTTVSNLTDAIDMAIKYNLTLTIFLHDTGELSVSDFETVCQYINDNDIETRKFSTLLEEMQSTA